MEKGRERKLWKAFSEYIRRRDADENGICKCITCGRLNHWKKMDCGHGIPRQYKSTKYHEQNNHAQCKRCNAFEGGRREAYKEAVNRLYGAGTWEKLEVLSKVISKRTQFEIDQMCEYYKQKLKEI